jgi:hypothetical protein
LTDTSSNTAAYSAAESSLSDVTTLDRRVYSRSARTDNCTTNC